MGFMDKLKNIFFEEEEDDEIDEPISPKKEKIKEKKVEKEEKKEKFTDVIAKKIELPRREKKEDKEKEIFENDFQEVPLVKETEPPKVVVPKVEKEPIKEVKEEVKPKRENKINQELIFDDEDFILDTKPKIKKEQIVTNKPSRENLYQGKDNLKKNERKNDSKFDSIKSTYGNKKEEVKPKTFTPSPIISPIYGILDKNYKKEEVKENKEIRISSRPSRMDLDSIRNKAFGDLEYDLNLMDDNNKMEEKDVNNIEKNNKEDLKKLYSKKDKDDSRPAIEKVTIGEADEYYNDLGLAYNTDYKDLSKDLSDGKVVETKKENKDNLEDNLFDLIDSMYDRDKDM